MITVIYTIRDRDPMRLYHSVNSLRNYTTKTFEVYVVDYGSSQPGLKEKIRELCGNLDLKYIRCESQGLPWCKSHALNIGIRQSEADYIMTTDIDMLFESDILKISMNHISEKVAVHCKPMWLPRSGDKKKAKLGDHGQVGGFQCIHRDAFEQLGGYDERIEYWGGEDMDWVLRLKKNGYRIEWIESEARMYHVWHPLSYGIDDRSPSFVRFNNWKMTTDSILCGKPPSGKWGKNILPSDRPVLDSMNNREPEVLKIDNYITDLPKLIELIKKQDFIRLDIGRRFQKSRPSEKKNKILNAVQKYILSKAGYEIHYKKNINFDLWYGSLPSLKKSGMIDYYISDNMENIYLLFEPR